MKTIEIPLPDETHRALVDAAHAELRLPSLQARWIIESVLRTPVREPRPIGGLVVAMGPAGAPAASPVDLDR